MVERKAFRECEEILSDLFPGDEPNLDETDAKDLAIFWVPVGDAFRIWEYDGSESVQLRDQLVWRIA